MTAQSKLSIGIHKYSDFVKETTAYLINVVSVAFSLSNCSAWGVVAGVVLGMETTPSSLHLDKPAWAAAAVADGVQSVCSKEKEESFGRLKIPPTSVLRAHRRGCMSEGGRNSYTNWQYHCCNMAPTGKERINKLLEQQERAAHVLPPSEHNIDASLVQACLYVYYPALPTVTSNHAFSGRGWKSNVTRNLVLLPRVGLST